MQYSNTFLLKQVLKPYKRHCRYLKSAYIEDSHANHVVTATGEFSIAESCYIADTGHFNAVEFNMCYNQLAYYLLAESIKNNFLKKLSHWNLEEFFRHQLSDCLILRLSSIFRKTMRTDNFIGNISINRVSIKNKKIFIKTTCYFYDEKGGESEGRALIVMNDNCK